MEEFKGFKSDLVQSINKEQTKGLIFIFIICKKFSVLFSVFSRPY